MLVEVAKYLSACPELEGRQVCINHLAENEESVSLEVSGSRDSVKEYADGGVMRGVTFILSIRDDFGVSQPESILQPQGKPTLHFPQAQGDFPSGSAPQPTSQSLHTALQCHSFQAVTHQNRRGLKG